jgi:hypothetical protein
LRDWLSQARRGNTERGNWERLALRLPRGNRRAPLDLYDGDCPLVGDEAKLEALMSHWGQVWLEQTTSSTARQELLQNVPRIEPLDFSAAVRSLSGDAIHRIVSDLTNETPGPDGLPYQVYPIFGLTGAEVFRDALLCLAEGGTPPSTLGEGILHLIGKDGRPTVDNLRPITITNTAYRIIATLTRVVIMDRVEELLDQRQKAFVPGRNMFDHVEEVFESFYKDQIKQTTAYYILVDFNKAFDRVDRSALYETLEAQGWGSDLRNVVRSLNLNTTVTLRVGSSSVVIPTGRGVRQGCPLSPLLFNLAIEPLLVSLRRAGVEAWAFADDVILRVTSAEHAHRSRELISLYERATGALMSMKKTVIVASVEGASPLPGWESSPHVNRAVPRCAVRSRLDYSFCL